jgi:type 1 glutamine amidotransferase
MATQPARRQFLQASAAMAASALVPRAFASPSAARILIVIGPSNHPPGTHEVAAGGRLLAQYLENLSNVAGVRADVVEGWPDEGLRETASSVVFIGDFFPPNRLPEAERNLAQLDAMMRRGCGMVCVHYATGLHGDHVKADGDHPLLRWIGGYFANRSCPHHQSVARVFEEATITPSAPAHPIWRGCGQFTLHDEPYIANYFGPENNHPAPNVTILATAMLPPEDPKPEPVAWCVDRADGGRGAGIVMPHFYRNWLIEDLRKLVLNTIVWSARVDVPSAGAASPAPDLASFKPDSIDPLPRARK